MDITRHLDQLRTYVETRRFAGVDPYDALNSPFLRSLTFDRKWTRIAYIQLLRRLPFNLRPLLRIPSGENPKALALFLQGYACLHRQESRDEYAKWAKYLIMRLQALATPTPHGHGWGYNFDWQSRAFFLPRFTPTVVCSSFVSHALLDAAETFGFDEARDLALLAGDFIARDLNRTPEGNAFCFSYSMLDRYAVHNANLLGASVLIRLSRLTGSDLLRKTALAALAYTMNHQQESGAWYYSEAGAGHWIDSFHTGFNLECIRRFLSCGEASHYSPAYYRGVQFYANQFFGPDGAPKYYSARANPIDVHCAATAISYLSGEADTFAPLLERILEYVLRHFWDERGFFHHRRGRLLMNRIPYMRWGQAWMFQALAAYHARRLPVLAAATKNVTSRGNR